jgi:hypothetical protein
MTQKFSQSPYRIQTRSQRHREGPCPRRLTKDLQPSSQILNVPREDTRLIELQTLLELQVRVSVYETLDKVLTPDRVCFFSLSGSNPRSTTYARMPKQNRTGTRP